MLGWLRLALIAVSMMAIFSRFSLPLMAAGNIMVLTATSVPFQYPGYHNKPAHAVVGMQSCGGQLETSWP
jgi:hypothetical protein